MTKYSLDRLILAFLRKVFLLAFKNPLKPLEKETDLAKASEIIYNALNSPEPCMISRFGAVEISSVNNYLGVRSKKRNIVKYITGVEPAWWWNEGIRACMTDNAGFFPNDDIHLTRFGELMLEDVKQIDVLASWQLEERRFIHLFPNAKLIDYTSLDCYWVDKPWTRILENKRILIVHPFSEEIKFQYNNNRKNIFENPLILPEFTLINLKSVQSIGGNNEFENWFEALDFMKSEIDKIEYDICLLGCGAYGMPLAAHIKRSGKKAVHIGGSLQLLFGIKGKRWEDPYYGFEVHKIKGKYASLYNNYWIRPGETSQIKNQEKVDNGCYW